MSYLFRSFTTFEVIDQETGAVLYKESSEPKDVHSLSELLGLAETASIELFDDLDTVSGTNVSEDIDVSTEVSTDVSEAIFTEDDNEQVKDDIFSDVDVPTTDSDDVSEEETPSMDELEHSDELMEDDEVISFPENEASTSETSNDAPDAPESDDDTSYSMDDLTFDFSGENDTSQDNDTSEEMASSDQDHSDPDDEDTTTSEMAEVEQEDDSKNDPFGNRSSSVQSLFPD